MSSSVWRRKFASDQLTCGVCHRMTTHNDVKLWKQNHCLPPVLLGSFGSPATSFSFSSFETVSYKISLGQRSGQNRFFKDLSKQSRATWKRPEVHKETTLKSTVGRFKSGMFLLVSAFWIHVVYNISQCKTITAGVFYTSPTNHFTFFFLILVMWILGSMLLCGYLSIKARILIGVTNVYRQSCGSHQLRNAVIDEPVWVRWFLHAVFETMVRKKQNKIDDKRHIMEKKFSTRFV